MTPLQANISKVKATSTLHEWQTDSLAAAAANAQLEGNDTTSSFTFNTVTATTRLNNNTQISSKTCVVSGTQDAVNKAGRKKEIVFQLMKRSKELRRDMEFVLTNNQTPVPNASASSTTARALRPINAWYSTNTVRGASGANGSSTAPATDGTQVALTEKNLKTVIQDAWTQGGDVDLIMTGPFNKTQVSAFSGNVTRIQDTSNRELKTAIDLYASDFGEHRVVPNKFSRDRDVHVLTTDLWAVAYLRPMQTIDLAKTGDSEKGMVLAEYSLESRNEAGSGIVADVTTS